MTDGVVERLPLGVRVASLSRICADVRREAGLTQTELTTIIGCGINTVSRYETTRTPTHRYIYQLEHAVGVPHGTIYRQAGLA